ncbi:MAG: hypothetical protein AAF434_08240 [Pseudomonadota bacterium]
MQPVGIALDVMYNKPVGDELINQGKVLAVVTPEYHGVPNESVVLSTNHQIVKNLSC